MRHREVHAWLLAAVEATYVDLQSGFAVNVCWCPSQEVAIVLVIGAGHTLGLHVSAVLTVVGVGQPVHTNTTRSTLTEMGKNEHMTWHSECQASNNHMSMPPNSPGARNLCYQKRSPKMICSMVMWHSMG